MDQTHRIINWNQGADYFINPRWPPEDKQRLLNLAQWASFQSGLQDSIWVTTSGSTAVSYSQVKLVGISKSAFLTSANAVNQHLEIDDRDRWASPLPLFHVGGLSILARAFLNEAKFYPFSEKWNASHFIHFCNTHSITVTSLVPTQLFDIVSQRLPCPDSLRYVILGGGPCSLSILAQAEELGWIILPSYGMTEASSQIATAIPTPASPNQKYDKFILPNMKVRITSVFGRPRIQIQSSALFSYYAWIDNGQFKLEDPKTEGWFTTEDEGSINDSNVLNVFGRSSGYFKIGGESSSRSRLSDILEKISIEISNQQLISPNKINSLHSALAIIPIPSERLENEIIFVVNSAFFSEDLILEIARTFNRKVLPFEKIRSIYTISEIPISPLGKILIENLKQKIMQSKPKWGLHGSDFLKKET